MAEANPARVIIVDPEPFFYEKMRACLNKGEHVVVGEAPNPEIAVKQLDALHPELVVVGPHLEEYVSFAFCREITRRLPSIKVVIFTAHGKDTLFQVDAVDAGIAACLSREMTDEECLAIIANAMAGHQLFTREILSLAFQAITLTRREREVLRLVIEGKTDSEIADALVLTFRTVRNHSHRILEKLGVHHREDAVRRAKRRGWL
jgi:DNA-binding NarL/FixJ family response regulator